MESTILDSVSYIKSISKQKVKSKIIFLYVQKSDESVSEEEIQNKKTIATLSSLNRLKEWGICTESYFILPLSDNVLAPQAQFLD